MIIHSFDRYDMLNNPGSDGPAFTIWFAGCSVGCEGCHNPDLQSRDNGKYYETHDIIPMVMNMTMMDRKYNDVILLGGEPLEQDEHELLNLCGTLVYLGFRIWLYTSKEISEIPMFLINNCHFIKTGPYRKEIKSNMFPASLNQKVYIRQNGRLIREE